MNGGADSFTVTAASPAASGAPLDDERLIELSRAAASRHLMRRHGVVVLALGFAVVAVGALLVPSHRALSLEALATSIVCYTLASRVQFEFGGVFAIPTQGVFVAMWFLLPPRMLPVVVCGSLLLAQLPDLVRGRMYFDRLALCVLSSWFSVGPALVLVLWGTHAPRWHSLPVYVAALAAQFALDYLSILLSTGEAVGLSPLAQIRSTAAGLRRRHAARSARAARRLRDVRASLGALLLLPVLLLFSTFAHERQHRIDNALELSSAYRGTAMLLGDVIEADDAYTGSHSRDVVELVVSVADRLGLDGSRTPARGVRSAAARRRQGEDPGGDHQQAGAARRRRVGAHEDAHDRGRADARTRRRPPRRGRADRPLLPRALGRHGYPDRLAGDESPLAARIVCACDAWSAMTTDRSYRKARSTADAAAELRACAGTHFDPTVVETLLAVLEA